MIPERVEFNIILSGHPSSLANAKLMFIHDLGVPFIVLASKLVKQGAI